MHASAFAHTTAVYVDVAGRRVAREADARWCLDFLDTLQGFKEFETSYTAAIAFLVIVLLSIIVMVALKRMRLAR